MRSEIAGFLTLTAAFIGGIVAHAATPFDGLCGEELKGAVEAACRPTSLVKSQSGAGGVWQLLGEADRRDDRTLVDRFSRNACDDIDPTTFLPRGMITTNVVVAEWWQQANGYGDTLRCDLFNVVPCNPEVPAIKGSLGPAEVTDQVAWHGDGTWATGLRRVEGTIYPENAYARFYQPPTGYEGDFARIFLYMITLYPDAIDFDATASTHCDGTHYPSLRQWAVRQMLAWNAADPVSDIERRRNDIFEAAQGNRNPFVDHPDLAEHIWGTLASEPYGGATPPDEHKETLKARYSLATDSWIYLSSPYVDPTATWSVDGAPAADERLAVATLGVGQHELRFSTASSHGKLIILITP